MGDVPSFTDPSQIIFICRTKAKFLSVMDGAVVPFLLDPFFLQSLLLPSIATFYLLMTIKQLCTYV